MQKLMGDEGGGGGACFSLLTPSVCVQDNNDGLSMNDIPLPASGALLWSTDKPCKQFGPKSDPTRCRALAVSKLFDTLMIFQKIIFRKG